MSTETPEPVLCHGPGCRREQTVPYWCSEQCEQRWNGRWAKQVPGDVAGLIDEVAAARIDQAFVEAAIAEQMPQPGEVTMAGLDPLSALLRDLAPVEVPQPFKLTREQIGAIRTAGPTYPDYARPSALFGTPVVLVDTVEESTPFQRAFPDAPESQRGAAYPQVASEDPQVARGWLSRLLGRMFSNRQEIN